jgi:hypothetical protein
MIDTNPYKNDRRRAFARVAARTIAGELSARDRFYLS